MTSFGSDTIQYSDFVSIIRNIESFTHCGICMEQFDMADNYPCCTSDECQFYICKNCNYGLPNINIAKAESHSQKECIICRKSVTYVQLPNKMAKYIVNVADNIAHINKFGIEHSNCCNIALQISSLCDLKNSQNVVTDGIVANGIQNMTAIISKILIDANQMEASIKQEVSAVQTKLRLQQEIQNMREAIVVKKESEIAHKQRELSAYEDNLKQIEADNKRYNDEQIATILSHQKQNKYDYDLIKTQKLDIRNREATLSEFQQKLDNMERQIQISKKEYETKLNELNKLRDTMNADLAQLSLEKKDNDNTTIKLAIQLQEFEIDKHKFSIESENYKNTQITSELYYKCLNDLTNALTKSDANLRKTIELILKSATTKTETNTIDNHMLPVVTTQKTSAATSSSSYKYDF